MYQERAGRLPGAVVWRRGGPPTAGELPLVLPDGCMDLLWTDGRLLIAGPDTRAFRPGPADGAGGPDRFAGVRFPPGTAPALLGIPAHELRDRRVELTELLPAAEARRLTAGIDAAADTPTAPTARAAAALEHLALQWAAATDPPRPVLGQIVRMLDEGRSVTDTAHTLGLGTRRLHRHSLAAFGYGPKTLARILRLQRALTHLRNGTPPATTATRTGYADQAHLTRELRTLTGLTPAQLRPPHDHP
ncbi:helix-turn-helix domain-containing protein [Streptomyces sp. NPDC058045]|uniref:helix-turn-helix domain-containing protein n=1 Tax=Streptomyces sp. NPDC058045 TaxID=3346311 RepID=UPI0036EDB263